jgi:hypothetical protein
MEWNLHLDKYPLACLIFYTDILKPCRISVSAKDDGLRNSRTPGQVVRSGTCNNTTCSLPRFVYLPITKVFSVHDIVAHVVKQYYGKHYL